MFSVGGERDLRIEKGMLNRLGDLYFFGDMTFLQLWASSTLKYNNKEYSFGSLLTIITPDSLLLTPFHFPTCPAILPGFSSPLSCRVDRRSHFADHSPHMRLYEEYSDIGVCAGELKYFPPSSSLILFLPVPCSGLAR